MAALSARPLVDYPEAFMSTVPVSLHPAAAATPGRRVGAAGRLLALAGAGAGLALLGVAWWLEPSAKGYGTHLQLGLPSCTWPSVFGVACPSCGMTTSFSLAVRGRFVESFVNQPMGFMLAVGTASATVAAAYVAVTGAQLFAILARLFTPRAFWLIGALALASWGWKIWQMRRGMASVALVAAAASALPGCIIPGIASAIGQKIEKDKMIEVLARYRGLENRTVAVLAHTDMTTGYENPMAVANIVANVASQIQRRVGGARVLDPRDTLSWSHQHPGWPAMPPGEVAKELDVERVVMIDIYEYRLNPPGNAWLWEGVAAANVTVIEVDGIDPDAPAEEFNVTVGFPEDEGVSRDMATANAIELGLQKLFVDKIAWLFYDHIEPKYPKAGR
jgi:hypothetical protein